MILASRSKQEKEASRPFQTELEVLSKHPVLSILSLIWLVFYLC